VAYKGIGYLAPVASNATAEGREMNRRVEVIIAPGK
jgi:OOP family OmpA-OmpF porin